MKVLVEDSPHFKIEMDLLYLNDDISKVCRYNYILDIVMYFQNDYILIL